MPGPSPAPIFRQERVKILGCLLIWAIYLAKSNPHGPIAPLRSLSKHLTRRLTAFQTVLLTLLYLYLARNFSKLLNLESPEPLAKGLYTRSYLRATRVLAALDAGFWTAMRVRRPWLRDLAGMVFSVYYLCAAERAADKVRRVRANITVDHLRVSWEKATTPYLACLARLLHPRANRFAPRPLRIPRPRASAYAEPINAWLYFEGTRDQLRACSRLVLDLPGGGYVAMSPRHHDDKLLAWARLCRVPVLSLDYRKAPEHPYPYALHECFDAYCSIVLTHGRCVGLAGDTAPRIALAGDSAGGNYAAGLTLMILNGSSTAARVGRRPLPLPAGVVLIYPSLNLNMSSWMSDEQLQLIRERDALDTNREVVRKKSEYYERASAGSRHPSTHSVASRGKDMAKLSTAEPPLLPSPLPALAPQAAPAPAPAPSQEYSTRLAMTSVLSYFNDPVLTPEMMRAMVILYIGPDNRPDFQADFLLSPVVAPDSLLARFPPVFFLTGERDPLVDDTVIFAGRIRAAKRAVRRHRRQLGLRGSPADDADQVEVSLIQGISHGFLQMASVFPQAHREIRKCAGWLSRILDDDDGGGAPAAAAAGAGRGRRAGEEGLAAAHSTDDGGGDGEDAGTGAALEGYMTANTSDDERPLEIGGGLGKKAGSGGKRGSGSSGNGSGSSSGSGSSGGGGGSGGGGSCGGGAKGRTGTTGRGRGRRKDSAASLGSEEDLVGRRMQGVANRLAGGLDSSCG